MSDTSRYHDCGGRARVWIRSTARGENVTGERPGRHAEALLRARVAGVDAPAVDLDRDAAERRDGVDEQQRVGVAQRGERRDVVLDAGRRLRVHDRDEARVGVLALRVEESLRIEREAPLLLDAHDVGAAAAGDLAHALAEHAVGADDRRCRPLRAG